MQVKRPVIGKYILDSLSIGMYNHPLMLLREYIQNSADAIDAYKRSNPPPEYHPKIDINIGGNSRIMRIRDNGSGIPFNRAQNVLHDLGNSSKKLNESRGFRGIGRLGGLGYCDKLAFSTKYEGEDISSTSVWDCRKIRQLMKIENHYDTQDILSTIIDFQQNKYEGDVLDHYFEVEMSDLSGSRDILLDVPLIKSYVSEVAPVPFNKKVFSFADEVDQKLRSKVKGYETYRITVNGEQIFKPYTDKLLLRGDHKDFVKGIEYLELSSNENSLAIGWMAKTKLLGTLSSQSHLDGLRVRKDNILVGDKNLLNEFYRESRFNNYLVGEIYAIAEHLVPNSRRDDFEDNACKDDFYESFIKAIGLPVSKTIRHNSVERSKERVRAKDLKIIEQAEQILERGYLTESQKLTILRKLVRLKDCDYGGNGNLDELIQGIRGSIHHLDTKMANGYKKYRNLIKPVFEILYQEHDDKDKAVRIINRILDSWT